MKLANGWLTCRVPDAYEIYERSRGVPRGMILANACGTGKTLVTSAAVVFGSKLREAEYAREGSEDAETPSGPRYKPSMIFCPAAVVQQTFDELVGFYGNLVRVWIFYGTANTCSDETRRARTLDNREELQNILDALERAHDDPIVSLPPGGPNPRRY